MATTHSSNTSARRVVGRPFMKGTSGNPGGRPRDHGLVAKVISLTHAGADLAAFMHEVFTGAHPDATLRDRMQACEWLATRAYGRPTPTPDPQRYLDAYDAAALTRAISDSLHRHVADPAVLARIADDLKTWLGLDG